MANKAPEKDYSFERQKILRHQRRLYFLFGILLVCIFFSLFSSQPFKIGKSDTDNVEDAGYIARIIMNWEIYPNKEITDNIVAMASDDSIKAVVLHLDSPGGSATGSEMLYNALSKVSDVKPVVSVVADSAASGAYMMALASDCIFANNTSIVGSVGVISNYMEYTELAEKVGINVGVVKSAPLKAGLNPYEKATQQMIDDRQDMIDDIFVYFKGLVQKERGMTEAQMRRIVDARAFTGRQALALNLIDAIGEESDAIEWLSEVRGVPEGLEVRDYQLFVIPDPSFLDRYGLMIDSIAQTISSWKLRGAVNVNKPLMKSEL